MKPDWKDAPPWANWLAMDYDHQWCWFERKPHLGTDEVWRVSGGLLLDATPSKKPSLERRP